MIQEEMEALRAMLDERRSSSLARRNKYCTTGPRSVTAGQFLRRSGQELPETWCRSTVSERDNKPAASTGRRTVGLHSAPASGRDEEGGSLPDAPYSLRSSANWARRSASRVNFRQGRGGSELRNHEGHHITITRIRTHLLQMKQLPAPATSDRGGRGHHVKPRHRAGRLPEAGFANSWRSTGPAVEQLPAPKVPSSHGAWRSRLILRGVVLLGPFSLGFHCGQSSTECSRPCRDSRFLSYSF
jgi:hypothetical protein